jgi:hypothetical protein
MEGGEFFMVMEELGGLRRKRGANYEYDPIHRLDPQSATRHETFWRTNWLLSFDAIRTA